MVRVIILVIARVRVRVKFGIRDKVKHKGKRYDKS